MSFRDLRPVGTAAALVLACLIASGASAQSRTPQAAQLLIDKSERILDIVFEDGSVRRLRGLRFGDGWNRGPKRQQGDEKTPEGEYRVSEYRTSRVDYPNVTFLPALYLDYPNPRDLAASAALGVDPGGAIMIHGPHPDFTGDELEEDWTDGCAALSREQMAYLMRFAHAGIAVTIRP